MKLPPSPKATARSKNHGLNKKYCYLLALSSTSNLYLDRRRRSKTGGPFPSCFSLKAKALPSRLYRSAVRSGATTSIHNSISKTGRLRKITSYSNWSRRKAAGGRSFPEDSISNAPSIWSRTDSTPTYGAGRIKGAMWKQKRGSLAGFYLTLKPEFIKR